MQKQIASSAVIILLFAVIAVVSTISLQSASALIATTTSATTTSTTTPTLPPLTLVHTKGTAYIDHFSDGSTTISVPGDPAIDSRFHEANAKIPTHPGMTWVGSNGFDAYDTPSGQLEVGDYAQLPDGNYLLHLPAQTYTDATSTSQWSDRYVIMTTDPMAAPTAPSSPAAAPQTAPPVASSSTASTSPTPISSPVTPATSSSTIPASAPTATPSATGTQATSTH